MHHIVAPENVVLVGVFRCFINISSVVEGRDTSFLARCEPAQCWEQAICPGAIWDGG